MNGKKVILGVISVSVRVIVLALVVMFVYKTSLSAYDFGFRIFAEPPVSTGDGRNVEVTIPMGKSTTEIGDILEEKGLIRDSRLFFCQEKLSAYRGKLQPGFYTLNTSMTANEMMEIMAAKDEESTEETTGESPQQNEGDGQSMNGIEGTDTSGEDTVE